MLKINRPRHTAYQTFMKCISRVKEPKLKLRLKAIAQIVANTSADLDAAAGRQELHKLSRDTLVGSGVTKEEMEAVYTQRMAKKNAPGRTIYDELISAPIHGKCPLCAQRDVTTLDHHLPKAHYPALAVVPLNLIPACGDCNKAKSDRIPLKAEDVPLHPYFDEIDNERWLLAVMVKTRPAALRFGVKAPLTWGPILKHRVRNHFKTLGLAKLYAAESAEELVNIRYQLIDIHDASGAEEVRLHLQERAESCRRSRRNGWRTAAYEAWAASDWFCKGGFRAS